MKIIVDRCEECGMLFGSTEDYNYHLDVHNNLTALKETFPPMSDDGCYVANDKFSVQRSKGWLRRYKTVVEEWVDNKYEPWSYAWFRCLDDSKSPYYGVACRALCVCSQCYREWGQRYYADRCKHGKGA